MDECKTLTDGFYQRQGCGLSKVSGYAFKCGWTLVDMKAACAAAAGAYTHFSAQPKLYLTQNTPSIPPNTPDYPVTPDNHLLSNPYMHPLSHRKRLR